MPPELALVERALLAFYPQPDPDARDVARKFLAVCLKGRTRVKWAEVDRLAALPSFNVKKELSALTEEVRRELKSKA